MDNQKRKDGCHKWLVFGATYILAVINIGMFYSFAALFVPIMNRFGASRAETAIVQSTCGGVLLCSGFISGILIHRMNERTVGIVGSLIIFIGMFSSVFATSVFVLVISLGVLLGAGMSPIVIGTISITGKHFEGSNLNRIVMSVLSTGSGVGGIIYPYIIAYLDEQYGLPGIFMILSGVLLNNIALMILWSSDNKPHKEKKSTNAPAKETHDNPAFHMKEITSYNTEISQRTQQAHQNNIQHEALTSTINTEHNTNIVIIEKLETTWGKNRGNGESNKKTTETKLIIKDSLLSLIRNKVFMMYCVSFSFAMPALNVPVIFIVDIFVSRGFSMKNAIFALLMFNVFSALGRICPGLLLKIPSMPILGVPMLALLLSAIGTAFMPLVASLSLMISVTCLIALGSGMCISALGATTIDLVGTADLSNAVGMLFTLNGIGFMAVGPLSGYIRDTTNSYTYPLVSAASAIAVGFVVLAIALQYERSEAKLRKHVTNTELIVT
ncbi:monocarboxylate transporter 4-like [Mya arenaria]|uniref:monocarboxylate transporter 4-like n=1 Tax=Mya arenaria TaxID=6604 RepID=UPI0022E01812|nr:monocarboxylate transporter 4-like [Mya arenaria]